MKYSIPLLIIFTILLVILIIIMSDFISIEFILIILGIFSVFLIAIITNMVVMKKIEKENLNLEKTSEEYIKNKKKIISKFKLICLFIYVIELGFLFLCYISVCMCGHREFKMLPIITFFIVQIIIDLKFFKSIITKDYTVNYLINYTLVSAILFISVALLSKNDVEALHQMDLVSRY